MQSDLFSYPAYSDLPPQVRPPVDAVVMASLLEHQHGTIRGVPKLLCEINGKPLIRIVLEAVTQALSLNRIAIVGNPGLLTPVIGDLVNNRVFLVEEAGDVQDNGIAAWYALRDRLDPAPLDLLRQIQPPDNIPFALDLFWECLAECVRDRDLADGPLSHARAETSLWRRTQRLEFYRGLPLGLTAPGLLDAAVRCGVLKWQDGAPGGFDVAPAWREPLLAYHRWRQHALLLLPCDTPFMTPEAVDAAVDRFNPEVCDVTMFLVDRRSLEPFETVDPPRTLRAMPRTALPTAEWWFRTSNIIMVRPNAVVINDMWRQGYKVRKLRFLGNIIGLWARLWPKPRVQWGSVFFAVMATFIFAVDRGGWHGLAETLRPLIPKRGLEQLLSYLFQTRIILYRLPQAATSIDVDYEEDVELIEENFDYWSAIAGLPASDMETVGRMLPDRFSIEPLM